MLRDEAFLSELSFHRLIVALWCVLAIYFPICTVLLLIFEIGMLAAGHPSCENSSLCGWLKERVEGRRGKNEPKIKRVDEGKVERMIEEILKNRERTRDGPKGDGDCEEDEFEC